MRKIKKKMPVPATTVYYKAKAIGDFGDNWEATLGSKVGAVNDPEGAILYIENGDEPFEVAIAMRSDTGTPEVPGIVFDPVHFTLDPTPGQGEQFIKLWDKDSNDNDWTLRVFNQVQLICYDNRVSQTYAQSFKFFPKPSPIEPWIIQEAGFDVLAKVSPAPEGRRIMVLHLRKVLKYV